MNKNKRNWFWVFWYFYLLAVSGLALAGYITINIILTAVLAAAVHVLSAFAAVENRFFQTIKFALLGAAAIALLWKESYLPSVSMLSEFLLNPTTRPSTAYLLNFAWQSLNFTMLAGAATLFAGSFFVYRKKPFAFALSCYIILTAAWISQPVQIAANVDKGILENFYKKESSRIVKFSKPDPGTPPFDIIILHVCSLSWSDIKDAKVDALPFLNKFNYVFTDFSAACSYSGPSALRVLKSSCGQLPHPLLYADSPPGCYLLDNLRAAGYKAYTMFNHDGKYADFRSSVPKYGHAEPPIDISDLPVTTRMFDDSPMSADAAVLRKFWRLRSASNEPRAVLYYNTANLHIGAHNTGEPRNPDDIAAYGERLRTMFAQFEEFFEVIKKSGRNAVIVLIPEHGAALTGTKMQPKDVREIPLPAISVLPMAVKLIGKSFPRENTKTQIITKPASLQALAWLLAEFLKENPYEASAPSPEKIAAEIPVTEFAAENENAAVLKVGFGYIYKQKGGHWAPLPASVYITPGTIPSAEDFSR